jgi:hypothetical protein
VPDLTIHHSPTPTELPPMPIEPADLIREGSPEARGIVLHQTPDKKITSGIWSCTTGVFDWTYTWDEFIRVLEGEVVMTEKETGESRTLKPGDCAHFPNGLEVTWKVIQPIKKFFVLRTDEPLTL